MQTISSGLCAAVALLVLVQLHHCCCSNLDNFFRPHDRPHGPLDCAAEDELQGATEIFEGWWNRAAFCLKGVETKACKSTSPAWLLQQKRLCAYKFTHRNGSFTYDKGGHDTCDHPGLRQRPGALMVVLNHLLKHPPHRSVALKQLPKFSFYYFVRDGQPTDNALRCHLGLPALVAGISHSDKCGLPVPHPHFLLAMIAQHGLGSALTQDLGTDGASKDGTYLLSKYTHGQAQPHIPWNKRLPKLVYRGHCTLTHDPDDPSIGKWLHVRPQLCNITASASIPPEFMDVGVAMDDIAPAWQEPCRACRKPSLPFQKWMPSRYHVIAEGYGPSGDASDLKFLSGGVVIWPTFQGYKDHLYYAWYQPLLKPGVNYFRPTMEEVGPLMLSCERHLQRQCMQVALRAHQMYLCKVTVDSAGMYLLKLMDIFSKWKRQD